MPQHTQLLPFKSVDPRPMAKARLNGDHYTSVDKAKQEMQRVWRKSWLLAGTNQDVECAGDFFTFEIGTESILITRTEAGALSAVYNVCQHRGNRLTLLKNGSSQQLACPYHGWTYRLDGQLIEVPDLERFSQGVDLDANSLKPVQVTELLGFVWINMDMKAAPLSDFLGHLAGELAPYHMERMRLVSDQTVSISANWKTVVDNFSEVYHVDFIHPQHASFVDCCDSEVDLLPFGHSVIRVQGYVTDSRYPLPQDPPPILQGALRCLDMNPEEFSGRVETIREAVQQKKRARGALLGMDYSELKDDQITDIWQYNLFPNIIMTVKPEEVWVMRARPDPRNPDCCLFDKWTLVMPEAIGNGTDSLVLMGDPEAVEAVKSGERPDHRSFTEQDVHSGKETLTITVDQDIFYLPGMQAGLHSAGFIEAQLNDDECRINHFHDWLETWLTTDPLLD